ncbi:hypothetical protein [Neptunomonas antarctica]|uniref:Uncharacterized protein n=1 Tax=Neptunomonas antarctica TaxID=619304 RepID=A0A1N7IV78_9GAMM|nr:hypothetical protein [Neptunomonas antarctica]SIS40917.1 hypothetical protein SAMN05421760_101173 [Neptunomonas antarctica]
MTHTNEEQGVETIGVIPSILMVLGGLVIAILPVIIQVIILMN